MDFHLSKKNKYLYKPKQPSKMNAIATENNTISMYVPRVRLYVTEKKLSNLIHYYNIGTVHSIDFIPLNKKAGFHETFEGEFKAAFVHVLTNTIPTEAMQQFWQKLDEHKVHRIPLNNDDYILCLKADHPVKRTTMNIHQIAESGRYLEHLISSQSEQLHKQSKELYSLKKSLEDQEREIKGLKNVVYQLVGGLFCQQKQCETMNIHLEHLGYPNQYFDNKKDTHRFDSWPTTRQGDENTKRIEVLEGIIHKMFDFKKSCYESDDEFTLESEPKSESDPEPMEQKDDDSDHSERMKNSYDLCGNA